MSGLTLSSTTTSYFFSRLCVILFVGLALMFVAPTFAHLWFHLGKLELSHRLRLRHAHQMQAETGCDRAMPCARLQGKNRVRELVSEQTGDGLHVVVAHLGVNREGIANVPGGRRAAR